MGIIKNILDGVVVVELFGELDHHEAPKVREELEKALNSYSPCHLVIDFGKVTFMDSSGIGVVLGRYKRLCREGRKLVVARCSAQIKAILEMAGVFSVISYAKDTGEAMSLLKEEV